MFFLLFLENKKSTHSKMQQFQDKTQNNPKTTADVVGIY
jgi:hypothetical protein